jgi:hypothetical protein
MNMSTLMSMFHGMGGMLMHPARTGRELAVERSLKPVATLVIAFGIVYGSLFLKSYLDHDYPPPPQKLAIWVEHWGEGVMLPFFNLPAESYRGFQAAIMLPFALALWMLMGGTARLLANLLGGRQSYETYLRVTGFTFFTIWVIAAFIDALFSDIFWVYIARGLQGEFGPAIDAALTYFMPLEYTVLYGLVAVNVAIATQAIEKLAWWRASLVGIAVFAWPMALVASVVR